MGHLDERVCWKVFDVDMYNYRIVVLISEIQSRLGVVLDIPVVWLAKGSLPGL